MGGNAAIFLAHMIDEGRKFFLFIWEDAIVFGVGIFSIESFKRISFSSAAMGSF